MNDRQRAFIRTRWLHWANIATDEARPERDRQMAWLVQREVERITKGLAPPAPTYDANA